MPERTGHEDFSLLSRSFVWEWPLRVQLFGVVAGRGTDAADKPTAVRLNPVAVSKKRGMDARVKRAHDVSILIPEIAVVRRLDPRTHGRPDAAG
jgi:hypothetical protein